MPGADEPIVAGPAWSGRISRRARQSSAFALGTDLLPPALITAVAVHELRYDHAGALTWTLVLAVIWPLALRRRAPFAVFAACLLVGLVLWARQVFTVAELALLVALYGVAAQRGLRWSLPAAAATEVGVLLLAFRFAPTGSVNDAVVLLTGLATAALLLGTTVRAQRRYLAGVEDRARRLERERAREIELAAAAERTRIARELHDVVAHGLSVVVALADGAALSAREDPVAATDAMQQAATSARSSLAEMRTLLGVLRADAPAGNAPQPDLAALDPLVADVRRTGLDVDLDVRGEVATLPTGLQTTVYRIVQESLTNVLKHADGAREARVTIDARGGSVCVAVSDDGRAAPSPHRHGNGLTGIRERVAVYAGTLDAGPAAHGWLVRAQLQLQ